MRISSDELKTFYWVAKLSSFNAAARHLHRTQPAVSQRIANLEKSLGKRLLDRSEHKAKLTRDGVKIFKHVEHILALYEEIESTISNDDPLCGTFRFGVSNLFAYMHLSEMLTFLKQEHPDIRVDFTVNYSQSIWKRLINKELDIGIVSNIEGSNDVICKPLTDIELCWVGNSAKLELKKKVYTPHDLVSLPIITTPAPSNLYSSTISWFGVHGLMPSELHTCNCLYSMLLLVSNGLAVSILPTALLSTVSVANVAPLNSEPDIPVHNLYSVYRKELDGEVMDAMVAITRMIMHDCDNPNENGIA